MENKRMVNRINTHFDTVYNSLKGIEVCCTTAVLCKEAILTASRLVTHVEVPALVQLVMSHYCTDNSHCNATLDDVAYFQHELAIDTITKSDTLCEQEKKTARRLCFDVHLLVTQSSTLEVIYA